MASQFAAEFECFYPKLIDSAIARTNYLENEDVKERIKEVTEYFTLKKIPIQGTLLSYAHELLEKSENINENLKYQTYTLSCVFETIQAYFIIQDDVFDDAKMRAKLTSWHLLPDASRLGMNDINLLRSFTNEIIRQNIDKSIYPKITDIYNEMFLQMEMAQVMDLGFQRLRDFSNFTMSAYNLMQHCKSSHYCLIAPIKIALVLSNKASVKSFEVVEDLCKDFGVLIQIHNDLTDYLDTHETLSGKSSTDIQCGKCSWPAVTALQHCNADQRKMFEENYGCWDSECVKGIRQLYNDLNILKLYEEEKKSRYDTFLRKVCELPKDSTPSPEVFRKIFDFFRSYTDDILRYTYA